jgi:TDG/mug DNA glycosylase family protein
VLASEPKWLAVVGVTAYRDAFGLRKAAMGRQDRMIGATKVWILPNPSGLNAHYTLPGLADAFAELRVAAESGA